MISRRTTRAITLLLGVVGCAASALAHFMPPKNEPVDRLIKNLSARTDEHPKSAKAWYALGRAHSLAFSRNVNEVPTWSENEPVADDGVPGGGGRSTYPDVPKSLSFKELCEHLEGGLAAFREATVLNAGACEHWISYAYLIECGMNKAANVDVLPGARLDMVVPKEQIEKLDAAIGQLAKESTRAQAVKTLRDAGEAGIVVAHRNRDHKDADTRTAIAGMLKDWWLEQAIEINARAFSCSLEADMKRETVLGGFHSLISHEAGEKCLRLIAKRGERPTDKDRIVSIKDGIKRLETREYPMIITPIVFPVDRDRSLASLVSANTQVKFDLDGTGRNQTWPWVKPDTAILVWDPTHSCKITSGRQLFGSVSWWIFFDNGYDALDALDDNRDGELTGEELKGIAVWVDRNGNGVSDPGEVTPIEQMGIRSIRVRATSTEDGCPANRDGIVMTDGRVLPTYDWIATPAAPNHAVVQKTAAASVPLWIVAGLPAAIMLGSRRRRNP